MRKSLSKPPSRLQPSHLSDEQAAWFNDLIAHTLDIDALLAFYNDDTYPFFEDESTLRLLADRYDLPSAKNFKELLDSYDMKYATIRSFRYKNRTPQEILLHAAYDGNLQLVVDGLKLHHEARTLDFQSVGLGFYAELAEAAAQGGHLELVKFFTEDLGAMNFGVVLRGAAVSGSFPIAEYALARLTRVPRHEHFLKAAIFNAAERNDRAMLNLFLPLSEDLTQKETSYWSEVLSGAIAGNHPDLVKAVADKPYSDNLYFLQRLQKKALREGHYELWLELLPLVSYYADDDEMLRAAVESDDPEVIKHFLPPGEEEAYVEALYTALHLNNMDAFWTIADHINDQDAEKRSLYVDLGVEIARSDEYSGFIWVIEAIKKGHDVKQLLWRLREAFREQGIHNDQATLILEEAWDNLAKRR